MASTLPLLAICLLLAGFGLDRAYQAAAIDAEFQKLQLQAWSLMADAEIEQQVLVMPEQLQEPQFSAPESELLGFVLDAGNDIQWRSGSAESTAVDLALISDKLIAVRSGESLRERLPGGEFILRQGVTYVNDTFAQHNLTFTVLGLGEQYRQQLAVYRQSLVFWLGLILSLLLVLQFIVLRWGLRPMDRLAAELVDLEQGRREALSGSYPKELRGVTDNLNQLLLSKNTQQARYRNTLSDLAHSLKTPLAVMQARLENAGHEDRQTMLDQVRTMDDIVMRQLKRAVIRRADPQGQSIASSHQQPLGVASVNVERVLQRLSKALQTVYQHKDITVSLNASDIACQVDESDLMEMLGSVMDNAFKYCRSQIVVDAMLRDGDIVICIEDDGQGIPAHQYHDVLQRGVRLDSANAGQGIGLAVAQDLIDAYGGELRLAQSEHGGAKVLIQLPFGSKISL